MDLCLLGCHRFDNTHTFHWNGLRGSCISPSHATTEEVEFLLNWVIFFPTTPLPFTSPSPREIRIFSQTSPDHTRALSLTCKEFDTRDIYPRKEAELQIAPARCMTKVGGREGEEEAELNTF